MLFKEKNYHITQSHTVKAVGISQVLYENNCPVETVNIMFIMFSITSHIFKHDTKLISSFKQTFSR